MKGRAGRAGDQVWTALNESQSQTARARTVNQPVLGTAWLGEGAQEHRALSLTCRNWVGGWRGLLVSFMAPKDQP